MNALLLLVAVANASTVLGQWDLDADDGGFVSTGATGQWEWGQVASGPGSGHTGGSAWGTVLDGPYLHDTTDYLVLPDLDLSSATRPVLELYQWYAIDSGGDYAWFEGYNGDDWAKIEPVYGYPPGDAFTGWSNGWVRVWVDLSDVDNANLIRLALSSDGRTALEGWYIDDVVVLDGDPIPPQIELVAEPEDTQDLSGPYVVEATVVDDVATPTATLVYAVDGVSTRAAMTNLGDGLFHGEIPGQAPDTDITWFVEATDGSNIRADPDDEPNDFRVYLAAPTDLSGPEGRVVGTEVELSWTAPDSPHEVRGYRIYRGDELAGEPLESPAVVGLHGPLDVFTVSAIYAAGEGDLSIPLPLRVHAPEVREISPAQAWQGDTVRVMVSGINLLFTEDDASLNLGDDVSVGDVTVVDANRAIFDLIIDADATAGVRDGALVSGDIDLKLPAAFEILDGEDRPVLTTLSPATLSRGDHATLTFNATEDFEACPDVDLGDGIIVESVTVVDGALKVECAVANDAALGVRSPVVDDGTRLLEGVELKIVYDAGTPDRSCATARGGGWLALLFGLGLLRRRQQC